MLVAGNPLSGRNGRDRDEDGRGKDHRGERSERRGSQRALESRTRGLSESLYSRSRRFQLVRDRHPLLFFGVPGATLTAFWLVYGAWTVSLYQTDGEFYVGKALLTAVLFIVSILSVYSALLMNIISNKIEQIH